MFVGLRSFVRIITFFLTLLGDILIFLSLYLPWFTFSGMAEHVWGTVEVSGWVGVFGFGRLYAGGAKVTMWSSTNYWHSGATDFWFGYLIVIGLILLVLALYFFVTKKLKISMLLNLIGCALVVATLIASAFTYKPYLFVCSGYIYDIEPDIALLYSGRAVVEKGLGFWFSLIGAFLSLIGMVLTCHHKLRPRPSSRFGRRSGSDVP
jgi:hypothetical protein